MAKIRSMFGGYAEELQAIIDKRLDMFAPTWFPKYFDWAAPQTSLSYTSIIGASRIEAAASIVDRMSPSPLRTRSKLETLTGNIPAIKEKFVMREDDYRDFLVLQSLPLPEATKKAQMLDLMFGDIKKAGSSPHKRLDILALEALSTGKLTLTTTNNPDGLVFPVEVDLLMPSGNKKFCSVVWSATATTTKPITDITTVVLAAQAEGRNFEKILMSLTNFFYFAKSTEVINSLISFNQLQKGAEVATLAKINDYLQANLLPVIEVVNEVVGVEKDGVISNVKPFSDTNVVFVPSGKLGVIRNAYAIEQMKPVDQINYGVYDHALISKWSDNDPWAEFTGVELNACPTLEAIDNIYLMNVAATA